MAPPLKGQSLMLHLRHTHWSHPLARAELAGRSSALA